MSDDVIEPVKDEHYKNLLRQLLRSLSVQTRRYKDSMFTSKDALARILLLREVLADHGELCVVEGVWLLRVEFDGKSEMLA